MTVGDRTLPHNLEAERSVLGAVLLHNDALPVAAKVVVPDDFYRAAHQRIFRAMNALAARSVAIDLVTLKEELGRTGELDEVGGPAYIAAFIDGVPQAANVEHYAATVREKARLRGVIFAANRLLERAYAAEDESAAIVDRGTRELFDLADTARGAPTTLQDAVTEYAIGLDAPPAEAMATGLADLDEMLLGGLRAQDLVLLAGRPSAGKSSLALCLALAVARSGVPCTYFSLEMKKKDLASRALAFVARVDRHRMERRQLAEADYGRISEAIGRMRPWPLLLQDETGGVIELSAAVRQQRRSRGLRCAVVDYMQRMLPEGEHESRQQEVASIGRDLKRLAQDEELCVVAISSIGRATSKRKDNRPQLADLRESGALEYDADVAVLIHRQEQYARTEENRGVAELIVAKNRNGPTGVVKAVFFESYGGLFENIAIGN